MKKPSLGMEGGQVVMALIFCSGLFRILFVIFNDHVCYKNTWVCLHYPPLNVQLTNKKCTRQCDM